MTIHIAYQGVPGAYGSIASSIAAERLGVDPEHIHGVSAFADVWGMIDANHIAVLPIENSYAGSIHENFYSFLRYDHTIIGEIRLPIRHALLSLETDITRVKKAFSHPQALAQCHDWLRVHGIEAIPFEDTAGAARMIAPCISGSTLVPPLVIRGIETNIATAPAISDTASP